jgi:signal transduction histidine kinase
MEPVYSPQRRSERLIAAVRVVLASASLFAVWLDPAEPTKHAAVAYSLLGLYLLYAGVVAWVVGRRGSPPGRERLLTHAFDFVFFSLFIYFTAGPSSPFTVYFIFSVACGSLRWGWRGALMTAFASLTAFVALAVYFAGIADDPAFELQSFLIRGVYLVVIAILLGYLGAHEQQTRREMSLLASWPHRLAGDAGELAGELLAEAAGVVRAPRALLVWNDPDEPWVHVAQWADGRSTYERLPPGTFQPPVAEALAGASFMCPDPAGQAPLVLGRTAEGEVQPLHLQPLHPTLGQRCSPGPVLAMTVAGETLDGWLFLLGKRGATTDDLLLGEVVSSVVAARLDHFLLTQRLQEQAATEERVRLARDLHDGVLQSLTGIALRLAAVRRMAQSDLGEGLERLDDLQRLIALEQRDLRFYIQELEPRSQGARQSVTLGTRLEELADRIGREWDLEVCLEACELHEPTDEALGHELYLIVREAVVNAVRHGNATRVTIRVDAAVPGQLAVAVTDNGTGFPFRGRFTGEALRRMGAGPRTLQERVAALDGTLVLESAETGARVEVSLPLGVGVA